MASQEAVLTKRLNEYSGYFTGSNGKSFIIGDEVGDQFVWHFVNSLKVGQSYKFPDAFTNFSTARYYVTAEEIKGMSPCAGMIALRSPCSAYFRTADGRGFGIGDPGSGALISKFLWRLKDGETYKFPETFVKYQATATVDEEGK